MGKIDEIKEEIGAIKTYLGFVIAFMITIGAGVAKLFLDQKHGVLFYAGIMAIVLLALIFAFLAKVMHRKIQSLKDF